MSNPVQGSPSGDQGAQPHDAVVVDRSHHAHVCSFQTFFAIYVALLFLTFVTVAVAEPVSGLHLGSASMLVAMLVATIKATLVMAVFMHLKWDTAANSVAFLGSLLFLSLLFIFTIADHATRQDVDPLGGTPIGVQRFGSE